MLISRLNFNHCKRVLYLSARGIRYTREYFQELAIDQDAIRINQEEKRKQEKLQTIRNFKNNDRNPQNYIKNLKINSPAIEVVSNFRKQQMVQQCAILTPEPPKQKVFVSAIRKYIITSIKKSKQAMWPVKKQYILDAIHILQKSHKKVAKLMVPTFYNIIRHAVDQGKHPLRLYVHGIIIGKTMRYKGIRYHARGKTGRQKKDICQIKVIMQQKSQQEFLGDVGSGKAPAGFATFIRQRLLDFNADHDQLIQYSGITTAKGRQQKRLILKRKAALKMLQNQKQGLYVPRKVIQKQIYQQQAEKVKELLTKLQKTPKGMTPLQKRQALYKKNMSLS